jgi:hypothetical protein
VEVERGDEGGGAQQGKAKAKATKKSFLWKERREREKKQ